MSTAKCYNKKWGHQFIGGVCLNKCGHTQSELSRLGQKSPPVAPDVFDRYLNLRETAQARRKTNGGPRNYWQETFNGYLKSFRWSNNTLDQDMKIFWITATKHFKRKPSGSTQRLLEWGRRQNCHVRQVIKALNNDLKNG